jgi:hypothetical protein
VSTVSARQRLNELLNLADIHLLPQNARAADLVMPSKLTGMLASGRPAEMLRCVRGWARRQNLRRPGACAGFGADALCICYAAAAPVHGLAQKRTL